jgi:hypothetical protein
LYTRGRNWVIGESSNRELEGEIEEGQEDLNYSITKLPNYKIPQEKVGNFTKSFLGTDSSGLPAFSQALSPPTMTNALNPLSRSRCATRALVASRVQVQ